MQFNPDNLASWPGFKPTIIAHDVGRSRDRSTAVVGGPCPFNVPLIGATEFNELPQGLYGSARASALAAIDRGYNCDAIIVADLSNDTSYGEVLFQTFGRRAIGVHITRYGDGMNAEQRPVANGMMLVYNVGRTHLIESLHNKFVSKQVRLVDGPMSRRAYEQLASLEMEMRDTGIVYTCPPGLHDDLAISLAMLAWAARHPHLPYWMRPLEESRVYRKPRPPMSPRAWT